MMVATLAAFGLATSLANAEGVTRVVQSDGSVQVYHNVNMRLMGSTLRLHSPDKAGFLDVASGACSFVGDLERCLPYATALHQHGETHAIALERGTVYFNLTDSVQYLHHSTEHLGPHEVLVLLHTMRGTIVSVKGTLDAVK
jgi:hypothetical protein